MRFRVPRYPLQPKPKFIEVWCHKHWDPIEGSKAEPDPIDGVRATELLLKAFERTVMDDPTFKSDILLGRMSEDEAANKALGRLAPVCCLFGDAQMDALRDTCRRSNLARIQAIRFGQ